MAGLPCTLWYLYQRKNSANFQKEICILRFLKFFENENFAARTTCLRDEIRKSQKKSAKSLYPTGHTNHIFVNASRVAALCCFIDTSRVTFFQHFFPHSLISVKSNEQLWAICSDCSRQMSDHERSAQVAQRKWATVSESLRLLKTNEQPWAIGSGRSEEMREWAIRSKQFGKKI